MLKNIIISIIILLIFMLLFGFRIFFSKKGKFPNSHIEGNKHLEKRGISCFNRQEREERERINPMDKFIKQ